MSVRLKRALRGAGRILSAVLLFALVALGWLLGTESGLRWSLHFAAARLPVRFAVTEANGRWLDRVELTELSIEGDSGSYRVGHLLLDWSPSALLRGELLIEALHADAVRATPGKARETPPGNQPFAPGWRLPLTLRLRDVLITDVEWTDAAAPGPPFRIDRVRLVADGRGSDVRLDTLSIHAPLFDVDARGDLALARAGNSSVLADWRARPPETAEFGGQLTLHGGWERLSVENRLDRPFPAVTEITFEALLEAPAWKLATHFDPVALNTVGAGLPAQRLGLDLNAAGTTEQATFTATALSDALDGTLQAFDLQGAVQRIADAGGAGWHSEGVTLRRHEQPGELRLSGTWREAGAIDADLNWRELAWPLGATPQVTSNTGNVALHGTLDAYRLTAAFDAGGARIPQSEARLDGRGDRNHLALDTLDVALLDGKIEGAGRVDWTPQTAWSLDLTAQRINPGAHWPAYPGRISAHVQTEGALAQAAPPRLTALLDSVSGTVRGLPLGGGARVRIDQGVTHIDRFELSLGDAKARLQGRIDRALDLRWTLAAGRLDRLSPGLAGKLDSSGTLSGPRTAPNVQARLNVSGLKLGSAFSVGSLESQVNAGLGNKTANLELHATGLDIAQRHLNDVRGFVQGTPARHAIRLRGLGPETEFALDGDGGWNETAGAWQGRVGALKLRTAETGAWSLARPIALDLGKDRLSVSDTCLTGGVASPPALVCADFSKDAKQWRLDARTANLALQQIEPWLPADTAANGKISGVAHAAGRAGATDAPDQLSVDLFLSPGGFVLDKSLQPQEVVFKGGRLQSALEQGSLNGVLRLNLVDQDRIDGRWRLPEFQWRDPARQKLELDLDGTLGNMALVDAWVPGIDALKGAATIKLRARGTLGQPHVSGVAGFDGQMDVPRAGIHLSEVKLGVEGTASERLKLSGHARSGEGTLDLDGALDLHDTAFLSGALTLTGSGFLAVDLREAHVLVTPDLRAELKQRDIVITGKVRIPEARLLLNGDSERVAESADIVIVEPRENAPVPGTPYRVSTDIEVILDDKVHFEGYGLATDLAGNLRLTQTPGALMTGNGTVDLKKGTYEAYGQKLTIESGRIFYTGGPLSQPGIDLRATRKTGDVLAGVKVTGTVQNPSTELYSEPALPQSDALSYLLLGRPLNQASSPEGEMLANAAMAIGLKGGNLLAGQLGSTFGFDVLHFESGGTYRDASFVVGKYLTPKLYLDYSVGLIDAINRLRVRYDLSDHWSVQTEAGTETGGDLLFTIER